MENVEEVKKKCKGKENQFGRRYGFEVKLRCVKLRLEEGLPVSLLCKEVGVSECALYLFMGPKWGLIWVTLFGLYGP